MLQNISHNSFASTTLKQLLNTGCCFDGKIACHDEQRGICFAKPDSGTK